MKILITFATIWLLSWNPLADFFTTRSINKYNEEARELYLQEKYDEAIKKYDYLINELGDTSQYTKYHKALAFYHKQDTASAKTIFQTLTNTRLPKKIKADAYFRLGNIALAKDVKISIEDYKKSLENNPDNLYARLNLELAMKLKSQQENKKNQQKKDDKNDKKGKKGDKNKDKGKDKNDKNKGKDKKEEKGKDSEKQKDQNAQKKPGKEGEKTEKQKEREKEANIKKKLKEIKMTPEKAQQILDVMKNKEMKYIQNLQKKSTKKQDRNKPDW